MNITRSILLAGLYPLRAWLAGGTPPRAVPRCAITHYRTGPTRRVRRRAFDVCRRAR